MELSLTVTLYPKISRRDEKTNILIGLSTMKWVSCMSLLLNIPYHILEAATKYMVPQESRTI